MTTVYLGLECYKNGYNSDECKTVKVFDSYEKVSAWILAFNSEYPETEYRTYEPMKVE